MSEVESSMPLPDGDRDVVGMSSSPFAYLRMKESVEFPGCADVSLCTGGSEVSARRPVEMTWLPTFVGSLIMGECWKAEMKWQFVPREIHAAPLVEAVVYFIADEDGYIKIGSALSVTARLKALQTATRHRLRVVATVRGGAELERHLHQKFAESHIRGEWFKPSSELTRFIGEVSE